jgi:hypothetical protein
MPRLLPKFMIAALLVPTLAFAEYREKHELNINGSDLAKFRIDVGAGSLDLRGDAGAKEISVQATIVVSGWSDAEAQRFIKEHVNVELYRKGDSAQLRAEVDSNDGRSWIRRALSGSTSTHIDIEIVVPHGIALEVSDGSGNLTISDLVQPLTLDDGSGNATLRNIRGAVEVEDGSGNMEIDRIIGNLVVEDGSGNLDISDIRGDVSVEDGSGNLDILNVSGTIEVDDGSGDIVVRDVSEDLIILDDGSGDLRVTAVQGRVRS